MPRSAVPSTSPFLAEAAHLRAFDLFRADFVQRYPGGFVFHDLAHLGATTWAADTPGGLELKGEPQINKVLRALRDFRRHNRRSDFRKSDGIGISRDGANGELIEITTVGNQDSAKTQLRDKLDTLVRTVNPIHALTTKWRPASWRPRGSVELYYHLVPTTSVISFEPTHRELAPDGVILYEVLDRPPERAAHAATLPSDVEDRLRRRQRAVSITQLGPQAWVDALVTSDPAMTTALRAVALVAGAGVAVLAVAAALDPIPGDEVAAYAVASALITFSLRGPLPPAPPQRH